ncbi:MAG: leucyl aminopeptidase [Microbacteriaceae bacterium]
MTVLAHTTRLTSADCVAVTISVSADGVRSTSAPKDLAAFVLDAANRLAFDGAHDSVIVVPAPTATRFTTLVLVGLPTTNGAVDQLRYAAGFATRAAKGSLALVFPTSNSSDATQVAEGAALAAIPAFTRKSSEQVAGVTKITVVSPHSPDIAAVRASRDAVKIVRDLVTEAPNHLSPDELAKRVVADAAKFPVTVTVFDEKKLAKGGFGGIVGVGQGSSRPPRMVVVKYSPRGARGHVALVGKGITFDTGGLSLKPAAGMIGMKYDMTGAATAYAVVRAAAQRKLKVAVTAWLCIAENMPSGTATRPNDVLVIRGGKTVEVTNTDAEGRIVLADGIVAASETNPDVIIDIATLTGSARVALGDRITAVMGDSAVAQEIGDAAARSGDETWTMPLPGYLRPILASDVADIANAKIGHTAAGMLIGGIFLKEFVGNKPDGSPIPWAHLDIAGPANNAGAPYGYTPKGATGVMVRTLVEFLVARESSASDKR